MMFPRETGGSTKALAQGAFAVFCLIWLGMSGAAAKGPAARTLRARQAGRYAAKAVYPVLAGTTPLVRLANQTLAQEVTRKHRIWATEAAKGTRTQPASAPEWSQEITSHTRHRSPRALSIECDVEDYTGGAHGSHATFTYNFGLVSGRPKRLALRNLFRPGAPYRKRISAAVIAKLRRNEGAAWVHDGTVKALDARQLERFCLQRDGLEFILDDYEVGPGAAGPFSVKLSLKELGPEFRREML